MSFNISVSPDSLAAKISKLQTSFQSLAESADTLNKQSDKFSNIITALDEALNRLSPGVSAWVTVHRWKEEGSDWISAEERLGFAKTNNRWGLSLSRVNINDSTDEMTTQDAWLFNDAPRSLRLRAVDHIPDLIESLAGATQRTAKEITAGAEIASELLRSVNAAVTAKEKRR